MNKAEKVAAKSFAEPSPIKEVKTEAKPGRGRKRQVEKTEQPSTPEKSAKVLKSEKSEEPKQVTPQKVSPKAVKNVKSAGRKSFMKKF
jgi:hypothetical protein